MYWTVTFTLAVLNVCNKISLASVIEQTAFKPDIIFYWVARLMSSKY